MNQANFKTLFTWEIRKDTERRWFYRKFERMISDILEGSCMKIDGSIYLVKEEYEYKFEELLLDFDSTEFTWQKFGLKKQTA